MKSKVTKFEILRRGAGLTVDQLAEKTGLTRQTIYRIENIGIENVNVKTLAKCAAVIGCSIVDFFI